MNMANSACGCICAGCIVLQQMLAAVNVTFSCLHHAPDWSSCVQTSMSGISVSDDAVNMYYFLKAKSTVRLVLGGFHPVVLNLSALLT